MERKEEVSPLKRSLRSVAQLIKMVFSGFFIAADKIDDKTVCFNKIKGLKSFFVPDVPESCAVFR